MRRIGCALLFTVVSLAAVACSASDDDHLTARQGYCISAKLDFGRFIRTASDASAKARDRASARSILGIFAGNGDEWIQESPPALRPESRVILQVSRRAAQGEHVALDDVAVVGSLFRVREYALRCLA